MMGIPGGVSYYSPSLQQALAGQHFQQNFNTLYGPFGIPLGQQSPYCQNCDCDGCKIHRERLRLQQEEELQRELLIDRAFKTFGVGDLIDQKPGSVIPLDVKPGLVTEEWWKKHRWKFYAFWLAGVAGVVHLFMTCATRQV